MGSWVESGSELFNGVGPTSYTDIDVSSIVGVNRAVCMISVRQLNLTVGGVSVRPKGESYSTYLTNANGHGAAMNNTRVNKTLGMLTPTDTDGVFQWKNSGGSTVQYSVVLEGYFIPSVDPAMIDSDFTMPTSWTDFDVSSLVGSNRSFGLHRHKYLGGAGDYGFATRPNGKSENYIYPSSNGVHTCGAQHGTILGEVNAEVVCALTDANGICEHIISTGTSVRHEIYLWIAEVDNWVWDDSVLSTGTLTNDAWTELDSGIGETGLAVLDIKLTATTGPLKYFYVRRKGDTKDWMRIDGPNLKGLGTSGTYSPIDIHTILIVPLDSLGKFEYYAQNVTGTSEWDVTLLGHISSDIFEIDSVVPSYLGLRVNFSKPTKNDAELNNSDNYQITVTDTATAFDFGAVSVIPEENVTYPTYVDLEMTDCTNGKGYTLVITPDKISSEDDDLLTTGSNEEAFTGVSELPEVLHVIPLSLTQVKVVFTKYMVQSSELMNIANYVWTGGIQTLKVEQDTNSSVIVTVTTMEASTIYDLTVG